jgi:hypothetical protein
LPLQEKRSTPAGAVFWGHRPSHAGDRGGALLWEQCSERTHVTGTEITEDSFPVGCIMHERQPPIPLIPGRAGHLGLIPMNTCMG